MSKGERKTPAENYSDAVTEMRTLSTEEFNKLVIDTRHYADAYHSWWIRALATVEGERIRGRKIEIGDKVIKTMGCHSTGVVVPRLALHECTDGTYRDAHTEKEQREWVSVKWSNGTQGYINRIYLSKLG